MTNYANIVNPGGIDLPSPSFSSNINDPVGTPETTNAQRTTTIPDGIILNQLKRMRGYYSEFFAGTQVKVYINDVRIEAVAIGWNASQTKTPIYGYASEQYDGVMRGNFIVNGELSIAFKEAAYLHLINEHIKGRTVNTETYAQDLKKLATIPADKKLFLLGALQPAIAPIIGATMNEDGTAQIILTDNAIEEILGGHLDFDTLANAMEDSIWGLHSMKPTRNLTRPDQMDIVNTTDRNGIPYRVVGSGFQILVTYGNIENPEAESTVKSLNDVHIIGSSQNIEPSSGFIIETFQFFARGLDEPIGGLRGFTYEAGSKRPDPDTFAPRLRTYKIDLTTGVDPSTYTFAADIMPDIGVFVKKNLAENTVSSNSGHSAQSNFISSPVTKVIVSIPHDWTESDPAYENITTKNPAARRAILRKLATVLLNDYINPGVEYPIKSQIVEVGGLLNAINIQIEIS